MEETVIAPHVTRVCGCPDRPGSNPHWADRFCRWANRRRRRARYLAMAARLKDMLERTGRQYGLEEMRVSEMEQASRALAGLLEAANACDPDAQPRIVRRDT